MQAGEWRRSFVSRLDLAVRLNATAFWEIQTSDTRSVAGADQIGLLRQGDARRQHGGCKEHSGKRSECERSKSSHRTLRSSWRLSREVRDRQRQLVNGAGGSFQLV
jgi:hypothetical protein